MAGAAGGIGRWFTATEPDRARDIAARGTEIKGLCLLPGGDFRLSGRADRIDLNRDGSITVVDYKTGTPPSSKQVATLLAPQLPLEAMMARDGGFGPDYRGRAISGLVYAHLTGRGEGGAWLPVRTGRGREPGPGFDELADLARLRLIALVARYRDPASAYPSRPFIAFEKRLDGDYDHLARVAEWSAGQGDDGDGEGEA